MLDGKDLIRNIDMALAEDDPILSCHAGLAVCIGCLLRAVRKYIAEKRGEG